MPRHTIRIVKSIELELESFKDWLSESSEEDFKGIIYAKYNIKDNELDIRTKERINDIIKEGYKDCLNMCKLLMDKGVYYFYPPYNFIKKEGRYSHWCGYGKTRGRFDDKYFELVQCNIFYSIDENHSVGQTFRLKPPKEEFESSVPCLETVGYGVLVGGNSQLMFDLTQKK